MATIEERLTALEQASIALRQADELQMIALRALVTKDDFEKMREADNKLLDVLMNHDEFTNKQLAELRTQMGDLDGKIVGLSFDTLQDTKKLQTQISDLNGKFAGLQTETRMGFRELRMNITTLEGEQIRTQQSLMALDSRVSSLQTEQAEMRQHLERQDKRQEEQGAQLADLQGQVKDLQGQVRDLGGKLDQILLLLNTRGF